MIETCVGSWKLFHVELFLNREFLQAVVSVQALETLWRHFGSTGHELQKGCSQTHVKAFEHLEQPHDYLVGFLVVNQLGIPLQVCDIDCG